jgi:ribonuclease D
VRRLSAIVQKRAGELGLAAEILATRRDLESIVRDEQDADVLQGWRRTVVGQDLLAAG